MSNQPIKEKDKRQKTSKSRREVAVQGTNDNSIVSKCSMVQQGYFDDPFLPTFVNKVTRRAPLIHRGYYIRAKVIEHIVKNFLAGTGHKQIVSLGAGFDSAYFRLFRQGLMEDAVYCEVDFLDLVKRKRALIESNPDMVSMIGEKDTTLSSPHIEICSARYKLLGVDLTQPNTLEAALKLAGIQLSRPTLLLSECVLTYMTHKAASAVVKWACETFTNSLFVIYEQINPNDPFGLFMQKHYHTFGSPLKCINHFPTLQSQIDRFTQLGWDSIEAMDMNGFYSNLLDTEERHRVEQLEMFDEYEEWHLKCAHYFVLCARQGHVPRMLGTVNQKPESRPIESSSCKDGFITISKPDISSLPLKRFGHSSALIASSSGETGSSVCHSGDGQSRDSQILTVGGFGEQAGKHMRVTDIILVNMASCNTCNIKTDGEFKTLEVSRMHSTVSRLKDGRLLLIGGRLSPNRLCTQVVVIEFTQNKTKPCDSKTNCDTRKLYSKGEQTSSQENGPNSEEMKQNSVILSSTSSVDLKSQETNAVTKNCDTSEESSKLPMSGAEAMVVDETCCDQKHMQSREEEGNAMEEDCVPVTCSVLQQLGDIPCPRWRHSAVTYQDDQGNETIVIFGGRSASILALDDCYSFIPATNQWTKIHSTGDIPEARQSHSAMVWNRHMLIAGGLQSDLQPLNSVYLLNLDTHLWRKLPCDIHPRYSHTSHVMGDYLVLIGGVNCSHSPPGVALVHLPSGRAQEFSLPAADKDNLVMLHRHTSVALDDHRIMLLGGGGNCFSFGTHLNSSPYIINIGTALDAMSKSCPP